MGSRGSQITLGLACVFTASTIAIVFGLKEMDFNARRVGLVRDDAKRSQRRLENEAEQLLQFELTKKYADQNVNKTT